MGNRFVGQNKDQRGIVSMVAVIFISILLSLLAVGLARLTRDEQRSATDLILSTRALYAAESGVQDALYDLQEGGTVTPSACHSFTVPTTEEIALSDSNRSSYTCVLLNSGQMVDDTIPHNRSYALNLGGITSGAMVKFEWFLVGTDLPGSGYNLSLFDGSGENPQCGTSIETANCASPPIMKVEVLGVPTGGFQRNDIRRRVLLLRPGSSGTNGTASFSGAGNFGDVALERTSQCNASSPSDTYMCSNTLDGFSPSYRYILVITPLYQQRDVLTGRAGTHFRTTIVGGSADLGGQVDVTARANDVFRRVVYNYAPSGSSLVPSYALLSDIPFCKNPLVRSSNGSVTGGTNPLTACR